MNNTEEHSEGFLSKNSIDTGFSVPKGYFDSVEDTFSSKLFEETLPKETGMGIPSGYFESLEDRILSKVEIPKKGKVISLKRKLIRLIPITAAASIVLFITLNTVFSNTIDIDPTSEEIAVWFDENISTINDHDLTSIFDTDDLVDSSILESIVDSDDIDTYINEDDTNILIEDSTIFLDEIN
jgi:hypothetical protein